MNRLSKSLLYLWSLSPVLALTCDKDYGTNDDGATTELRFSIINLMLGDRTYYFLTTPVRNPKIKFRVIDKITLQQCVFNSLNLKANMSLAENMKEKSENFVKSHLDKMSQDEVECDMDVEKEFICYRIDNETNRTDLSFKKMNFYMGIILVLIPLMISAQSTLHVNTTISFAKFIVWGTLGLMSYTMFNWFLYTIQYMKVSGLEFSKISTLINPPEFINRKKQLIHNYYYDWQIRRSEAVFRVSFVCNTERCMKWSIGLFVLFALVVMGTNAMSVATVKNEVSTAVYTMELNDLNDTFSEDRLVLEKIHVEIKEKRPQYVFIITGEHLNQQKLDYLISEFKQYENEILIDYYTDATLDPGYLKIMLAGGN